MLNWDADTDFWSPERDAGVERAYSEHIWLGDGGTGTSTVNMPEWEHLRCGINMQPDDASGLENYIYKDSAATVGAFKNTTASNAIFQDKLGDMPGSGTAAELTIIANQKIVKQSPVGTRTLNPLR